MTQCLVSMYDVKSTMPTPTRNIREGNALGMVRMMMMMLWKKGWLSEEEYLPSGAKELHHPMRHVVVVPCEQLQCYPMGR